MIKRFKNSKYFYESDSDSITIKKILLSKPDAITTIIGTLIYLPFLISSLIFRQTVYHDDSFIISILFIVILTGMLVYSIMSLVWKPLIAVFYKDYMIIGKGNKKVPCADITKIETGLYQSSHALRGSFYQVDHPYLFIELNNAQRIKLVEIADRKHSDELDAFKLLLEQFISINKTDV